MSAPPATGSAGAYQAFNTRLWLVLSLLANLLLVLLLYFTWKPLGLPTLPPPVSDKGAVVKTDVVVRHENFTWDQVESTNYVIFVKNLRAVGCPEQTIRDIIVSEINRLYAHRRLAEVVYPNYQWWRPDPDPAVVEAAAAKIEALEAERRSVLTGLLGPGWEPQNNEQIAAAAGITLTGPVLGDLPPQTKDAVYAIVARNQAKILAYEQSQRDKGKALEAMEIVRLRNEGLTQLVPVLNPGQYEEFALRYSPSGEQLREQMRSISMEPDQFRGLFNAISSINGQPVFYYAGSDPALLKQQQDLRAQSDAIIKETLGDQLYATYQLNQDPLYRTSKATAEQLGVPETSVTPMYEINRATQAELNRIHKDTNMTSDEKVEAISQARVEQQQSLAQILGAEAFDRWLQTHTGVQ
jgi:hypothetical protein